MSKISILDEYENKQIILYGTKEVATVLFDSLTKYNMNVIGYCGHEQNLQGNLATIPLISPQELNIFLETKNKDSLLVQLAFSPQFINYEFKITESTEFLQNLGVKNIKTSSESLGDLLLLETAEEVGLTEESGKQWLVEFSELLEDDKSREILDARISKYFKPHHSNILEIEKHFPSNPKNRIKRENINEFTYTKGEPIIFYGIGEYAVNSILENQLKKISPDALTADRIYCDKKFTEDTFFNGYPAISPQKLIEQHTDKTVIITTVIFVNGIYDFLIKNGFNKEKIFFSDSFMDIQNQYFDKEIIKNIDNEVFVDIGVLNGYTSINFAKRYKYDNIFLFEPNKDLFDQILINLKKENITKFEMFPIGLWDNETVLEFSGTGGTFGVDGGVYGESHSGIISIPVNALDNVIEDKFISFVKMDIEGSEMKALLGAEKAIRTHKPKIAISLYHRPEDLFDIPRFLKKLVPEYKFYLRHYSTAWHETVLYAVIED